MGTTLYATIERLTKYFDGSSPDESPYGSAREIRNDVMALIDRVSGPPTHFEIDFNDLWREHGEWSQGTFGNDNIRGPVGPLKHLAMEASEAAAAPRDIMEYADCFLLLIDATRRAGWTIGDLLVASRRKLEINKQRQWEKSSTNEPVLHRKTEPERCEHDGSCSGRSSPPPSEQSREDLHRVIISLTSDQAHPDQRRIAEVGIAFVATLLRKNSDYGSSAWKRPILAPDMPPDAAIRARMSDKIERLATLFGVTSSGPQVTEETLEETMGDLGAYALLWLARPKSEGDSR